VRGGSGWRVRVLLQPALLLLAAAVLSACGAGQKGRKVDSRTLEFGPPPAPDARILVTVLDGGTWRVDGSIVGKRGLGLALLDGRTRVRASGRDATHVLIECADHLPWIGVHEVLRACIAPRVGISRVLLACGSGAAGKRGVFAWFLPVDPHRSDVVPTVEKTATIHLTPIPERSAGDGDLDRFLDAQPDGWNDGAVEFAVPWNLPFSQVLAAGRAAYRRGVAYATVRVLDEKRVREVLSNEVLELPVKSREPLVCRAGYQPRAGFRSLFIQAEAILTGGDRANESDSDLPPEQSLGGK